MNGDPDECRKQAESCLDKAKEAADDDDNFRMWFDMAQQWVRLAAAHDNDNPFLEFLRDLERRWRG